jgi:quercetin dioxygenase-like cupin family protein
MAFAAMPFAGFSTTQTKKTRIGKGFKISAGEGRIHGHIMLKGTTNNIMDVKISGTDTDGDLALFEQTGLSQGRGTALHVHQLQDETFYILEGEYYFQTGEDKYHLTAGDRFFLPRKVPHAWTQVSKKSKALILLQPAGKLENFFVTIAGLKKEPAKEEIDKIFAENDIQVVGPPLKIE